MDDILKKIYYEVESPASYSSVTKLYKLAKEVDPNIARKYVKEWLSKQESYTLHAPVRRRLPRSRIFVRGIDKSWQSDLMDMQALNQWNDKINFLLVVIDVFSKYLFVIQLRNKSAKTTHKAIESLLDKINPRKPVAFQTDRGGEFNNEIVKDLFKSRGINFYTTTNAETKCSVAERVIRTIKATIYKYLSMANTFRYIDVLDKIVQAYNNSKHRSINMAPSSVTTMNEQDVFKALYPHGRPDLPKSYKFSVGDTVRLAKQGDVFTKGYRKGYTDKLFTISEIWRTVPTRYKIKDTLGEPIEGSFYTQEMIKAIPTPETLTKIEKVIKKMTYKGKKQLLVKWVGYSDKFNSWINEKFARPI